MRHAPGRFNTGAETSRETARSASQNSPYRRPKRHVLRRKTVHFATRWDSRRYARGATSRRVNLKMLTQLAATASPEGTVRRGDGLQAEQQPRGAVLHKQPVQQYRGNYPDCHGNGGLRREHVPQSGVERKLPEHGLRKSLEGGVEEVDDVRRGRHCHEPARPAPFAAPGNKFGHLEHKPDAYVREGLPNNECTFTPPRKPASKPAPLRTRPRQRQPSPA